MSEKKRGTPSRGISVFSYNEVLGTRMTLDDVFKDMYDTGATCFEFLTSHVENYPNPSTQWLDHYFSLCDKYHMRPAEMGHWMETHLHRGPRMSDDDVVLYMVRDIKLAHTLGFTTMRTKITCMNEYCDPEPGWDRLLERLLPYAEKYNVTLQSECHRPTTLTRQHIYDYLEFIEKHDHTPYFGINVDFSTFQNKILAGTYGDNEEEIFAEGEYSKPEDIIPILPYCKTCHAKFNFMDDDFEEKAIPYKEVMKIILDEGWSGDLISEFESPGCHDTGYIGDQLRRQHVMLNRILGY